MADFVLVHGGGLGAWCWEEVRRELAACGHESSAPDLSPSDFGAGAEHCARVIEASLRPDATAVLVGHSIAGLIIPVVAAHHAVRRLVFLHALLPQPGQSVVDQLAAEPDMFNPAMFEAAAPFWEDEGVAREFLLHDCPDELASAAFRRLRPEPGTLGAELTPLESWPPVPACYVVCRDDRTATPAWARRAARRRLGVEPLEIPGGHCPMLSRPAQLAAVLAGCV